MYMYVSREIYVYLNYTTSIQPQKQNLRETCGRLGMMTGGSPMTMESHPHHYIP